MQNTCFLFRCTEFSPNSSPRDEDAAFQWIDKTFWKAYRNHFKYEVSARSIHNVFVIRKTLSLYLMLMSYFNIMYHLFAWSDVKFHFCLKPLVPEGKNIYRIAKICFRKTNGKNFLWAPCLWVGIWYEPILGYISIYDGKKSSGSNGLIIKIIDYHSLFKVLRNFNIILIL